MPQPASFFETQSANARTVMLTGASGVLGSAISTALKQDGWKVITLVRQKATEPGLILWDPFSPIDSPLNAELTSRLNGISGGISAAVHLSGANVASKRWTASYKREIRSSRVQTTAFLSSLLSTLSGPPRVLVSASAIGYYGNRGGEVLDESSPAGTGFFPQLCQDWEDATRVAKEAGMRIVHPRFGVVLSRSGGALAQMKPLFQTGLGGKLGNGKQWMSWISQADAASAVLFALKHPTLSGAFNASAPEPVTNANFTQELAAQLHRPAFMTAPAFALRLAFGEMADQALLASTRALPRRLTEAGFAFQQPTLSEALKAVLD